MGEKEPPSITHFDTYIHPIYLFKINPMNS